MAKDNEVIYLPTLIVSRGYLNVFRSLNGNFEISDPNNVVDIATKNLLLSGSKFFPLLKEEEEKYDEKNIGI